LGGGSNRTRSRIGGVVEELMESEPCIKKQSSMEILWKGASAASTRKLKDTDRSQILGKRPPAKRKQVAKRKGAGLGNAGRDKGALEPVVQEKGRYLGGK